MTAVKKVVLAYSGGLDTSVIVRWLQETYRCEVVTFTADIGQGEDGLCAIRRPAGPDCGGVAKPAGDFVAALLEPAGVEVLGYKVRRVGLAGLFSEC